MTAAAINTPRIIQAMRDHGWGVLDTCVNCKMNCKTVKQILDGKMPKRIDALYRLCDGLELSIEEALIVNGGTHHQERGPRRDLVSGRGRVIPFPQNKEQG
jgi:hypothetical protein